MKKILNAAMLLLGLSMMVCSCGGGESQVQNAAISYMQANVYENADWYPAESDIDEVEDALVDLGAPEFKRGQHAVEVIVDLYGLEQSYIVWLQDKEVLHYEMTGNVNVGKLTRYIYPKLTEKGWR